jgi:hypothetical protein
MVVGVELVVIWIEVVELEEADDVVELEEAVPKMMETVLSPMLPTKTSPLPES